MLASIGLWLLTKLPWLKVVPWGAVGKLIARFWREFIIACLVFWVWHRGNVIEALELELDEADKIIEGYKASYKKISETLAVNEESLLECVAVNHANIEEAERQAAMVAEAIARAEMQKQVFDARMGEINAEAQAYRGRDTGCRSLHSPDFPQWFIDWVQSDSTGSGD